jgi:hypothetical protein
MHPEAHVVAFVFAKPMFLSPKQKASAARAHGGGGRYKSFRRSSDSEDDGGKNGAAGRPGDITWHHRPRARWQKPGKQNHGRHIHGGGAYVGSWRHGSLRDIGLRLLLVLTRRRGLVSWGMVMTRRIDGGVSRCSPSAWFGSAQRRALDAAPNQRKGEHGDELPGNAHPKKIIAPRSSPHIGSSLEDFLKEGLAWQVQHAISRPARHTLSGRDLRIELV